MKIRRPSRLGNVISTNPVSGTTLTKGEKVNVDVSLGVQALAVVIPDVTNMSIANAEVELTSSQFKLNYTVKFVNQAPAGVARSPTGCWLKARSPANLDIRATS